MSTILLEQLGSLVVAIILFGTAVVLVSSFPSKKELKESLFYKGMLIMLVGLSILCMGGAGVIITNVIKYFFL